MVQFSSVQQKNAEFAAEKHTAQVAIFVGATSGIGKSTLAAIATLLVEPTFYVVGRSAARFTSQQEQLQALNQGAKIVFIEAEISQLAEVDRVCQQISEAESRVDYLCMSPGYLPVAGPIETKEGLEQCFTLSYFARIRFINNLLPLLRQSSRPRVLSILNAGKEEQFKEDDLGLKDNWTIFNLVHHATTFMTLVFYHLAEQNKGVTFIHVGPGQVRTGEPNRKPRLGDISGIGPKMNYMAMRALLFVLARIKSTPPDEAGQRHAFNLTSDQFGPGAWRAVASCDEAPASDLIDKYRKDGWPDKIWDFTLEVWKTALRK